MSILALTAAATLAGSLPPDPGPAFRPGLLVQTWMVGTDRGHPLASLRLRRLELQARGTLLGGGVRYVAMAELGQFLETIPLDGTPLAPPGGLLRQNLSLAALIKDLNLTFRTPLADIQVGQGKIPVSLEGLASSSNLLLPERAAASTEFGYKRDLGIQAMRSFGPIKTSAGLFARRSIQELVGPPSAEPPRDGAIRLDVEPLAGLRLGAVAYGTIIGRGRAGTRDRGELDLRYEAGPVVFQGEWIQGADIDGSGTRRRSQGAYASAGYRLMDSLQPVLRLGYLDRDLDGVTGTPKAETQFDVGVNVAAPLPGLRFQTAWSITWGAGPAPAQTVVLVSQYRY